MKELIINSSSLSERSIKIVNMVDNDRWSIDSLVERTFDVVHVVVQQLCLILAALSFGAIIVTWFVFSEDNQSWLKFGWWFVGAAVLFAGLAAWSFFRDKTELLRGQKRAELEKRSAADPKLVAPRRSPHPLSAKTLVSAIGEIQWRAFY